jgi:cytochrome c-type biogenesis protein CcmE
VKSAHIFAFFIISLALGFAVFAFMGAVPQYLTIKDARNSTTPVQVKGKILHDTVNYDNGMGALRFQIEDDNKERIQVVYRGAKPDAFDTAPETAATGLVRKSSDGTEYLDTKSIIVKCPSKYDDRDKKPSGAGAKVASARQGA